MKKELIKEIQAWCQDFEAITDPKWADEFTFEGSAYLIFRKILGSSRERGKKQ